MLADNGLPPRNTSGDLRLADVKLREAASEYAITAIPAGRSIGVGGYIAVSVPVASRSCRAGVARLRFKLRSPAEHRGTNVASDRQFTPASISKLRTPAPAGSRRTGMEVMDTMRSLQ